MVPSGVTSDASGNSSNTTTTTGAGRATPVSMAAADGLVSNLAVGDANKKAPTNTSGASAM